jgi:hypothetical protein
MEERRPYFLISSSADDLADDLKDKHAKAKKT